MGGIINAYYDVVSPYSYFAYVHLQRLRDVLASHGVSVEIHPIFLGGIMKGSGNNPPLALPAKAAFGKFELRRAIHHFGVAPFRPPSFFPILTILPQRAITYIKHTYPPAKFEAIFGLYFQWFFYQHLDLSKPEVLRQCLESPEAGFTAAQAQEILDAAQSDKKWKDELTAKTQEVLDKGAFGAPFFWVVRDTETGGGEKGKEAAFWGSDRFHHIWEYLGLPWDDVKLHARSETKL